MTSRTPIRLTPHRGPLATPSASPESSPTLSTPPVDISHCSTAIRQALDAAILQHGVSTPSPPVRHQPQSRLYRRRREVTEQKLFGCSTHLCPLSRVFESLICSTCGLAKSLSGIVTFCLLIWGLLEWSLYVSELPRQPNLPVSMSRFPLPSSARALRCHVDPSVCEPRDQHAAVLQFLFEQIQHAKALSSLSISLGVPLRAFFEIHRATIPRAIVQHNPIEPHLVQGVDVLVNLTEFLDPPLLDFTSGSFVGKSLILALDELNDLISEPVVSHSSLIHGEHQDAHLHAIYWRTTSNLLLEYSAARPRVRRLLQQLHAVHEQLSPLVLGHHTARRIDGGLNTWWWKSGFRHHAASIEEGTQAFVAGVETTLHDVHRLVAYLDWITRQLAQTTLRDVLKMRHKAHISSCMSSLQELFAQSKPSTTKKHCFCLNDHSVMSGRPERVEIVVPGSPTVRTGR